MSQEQKQIHDLSLFFEKIKSVGEKQNITGVFI